MPDPQVGDMCRLQQVLKGIEGVQVRQGRQPRVQLPITPAVLRSIRQALEVGRYAFDNIMPGTTVQAVEWISPNTGGICAAG